MLLAFTLALAQTPSTHTLATADAWVTVGDSHVEVSTTDLMFLEPDISLIRLEDGTLVTAWNRITSPQATPALGIARSHDGGKTWESLPDVASISGASLFSAGKHLGLVGAEGARGQGRIVVRRSEDWGRTWSEVRDERTGAVRGQAESTCRAGSATVCEGRLFKLFARKWDLFHPNGAVRETREHLCVASVALDADWLDATNWRFSSEFPLDVIPGAAGPAERLLVQPVPGRLGVVIRGWAGKSLSNGGLSVTDAGHTLSESSDVAAWTMPAAITGCSDVVDPVTWWHVAIALEAVLPGRNLALHTSQNDKQWLRRGAFETPPEMRGLGLATACLVEQDDLLVVAVANTPSPATVDHGPTHAPAFLRVAEYRSRILGTPPSPGQAETTPR